MSSQPFTTCVGVTPSRYGKPELVADRPVRDERPHHEERRFAGQACRCEVADRPPLRGHEQQQDDQARAENRGDRQRNTVARGRAEMRCLIGRLYVLVAGRNPCHRRDQSGDEEERGTPEAGGDTTYFHTP